MQPVTVLKILRKVTDFTGSWPFQINKNKLEGKKKTRSQRRNLGKTLLGPPAAVGEQTTSSLACSLLHVGQACSLYRVRVEVCPGVWLEGCLRCFAHSLMLLCAGSMLSTLLLLQALQKWRLGLGFLVSFLFVSLYLLFRICPNWWATIHRVAKGRKRLSD